MNEIKFVSEKGYVEFGPIYKEGHIWRAYSCASNNSTKIRGKWVINGKDFSKRELDAAEKATWKEFKAEN